MKTREVCLNFLVEVRKRNQDQRDSSIEDAIISYCVSSRVLRQYGLNSSFEYPILASEASTASTIS